MEIEHLDHTVHSSLWNGVATAFPSLTLLYIRMVTRTPMNPPCIRPSIQWFQPLSSLSNLRRFGLRTEHPTVISATLLKDLVSSWPQLTGLDVSFRGTNCQSCKECDIHNVTGLQIGFLETLLDSCPNLKRLGATFQSRVPKLMTGPTDRFKQMQVVSAYCSAEIDPRSLAGYFSAQGLSKLEVGESHGQNQADDLWKSASGFLQTLNVQRREHETQVKRLEDEISILRLQLKRMTG